MSEIIKIRYASSYSDQLSAHLHCTLVCSYKFNVHMYTEAVISTTVLNI